jgi:hypothetical protein
MGDFVVDDARLVEGWWGLHVWDDDVMAGRPALWGAMANSLASCFRITADEVTDFNHSAEKQGIVGRKWTLRNLSFPLNDFI